MEDIRLIERVFVIFNRYKDELEKRIENSTEEEKIKIENELKEIDNLMNELNIKMNEEFNEEDSSENDMSLIDLFENKEEAK